MDSIAKHYKQSIADCNNNPLLACRAMVWPMAKHDNKLTARQIVAANVKRLMQRSALNTQDKLGKAAGLKQRTIGYLLDPETTDMKSPKLDTVEKVARAFGLEPWVLLVDPKKFGQELSDFLHRPPVKDSRLRELGEPPLMDTAPAVRGKRGAKRPSFTS
jgi:hypothetical protein